MPGFTQLSQETVLLHTCPLPQKALRRRMFGRDKVWGWQMVKEGNDCKGL